MSNDRELYEAWFYRVPNFDHMYAAVVDSVLFLSPLGDKNIVRAMLEGYAVIDTLQFHRERS